ncbi:MAG: helix-turn-helix domain-containing protein, partial [Propionibacteriaceae bacterium]|nr:helix-turn-helix domain-containing protein [Propionibacteriaceae bacterium]
MDNSSGVGVLDKAALVLTALEQGPTTLTGLVSATGLARPTAHRLAVALEHHRLVSRDLQGRFVLGPRLAELAAAAGEDRLLATAMPVLKRLQDITGESAQLFRRQGEFRICAAAVEPKSGLRDTIPVGTQVTMGAGSAAQVLLAWEDPEHIQRGLQNASFSAVSLANVRRRGWAQSVAEREPGVA